MIAAIRRLGSFVPLPTGRAVWLLVAIGVAMILVPSPSGGLLVVVDIALFVVVAIDAALARFPRTVERELANATALRRPTELTWHVVNDTRRRMRLAWADELAPSLGGQRRAEADVPAGAAAIITTTLRPHRRGRFRFGTVTVRSTGPLGLGRRQRDIAVVDELIVVPVFPSRPATELRLRTARPNEIGLHTATARGSGTEFDSLRDYTVDDESRRIDWAATARAGRPIVRAYRVERHQNIGVLLDTGRTMGVVVDGAPRLEHAMDATLALATAAASMGDHFGLLAADTRIRSELAPVRRTDHLARVTLALHDLEPALVETDHASAMETLLRRFTRRSLIVVLTDLAEYGLAASLRPALTSALSRHLVVIGAVRDPAVHHLAERVPTVPSEVYEQTAALDVLAERRNVASWLRAAGADVIDAAPGRLGLELVDHYLDTKARGRL